MSCEADLAELCVVCCTSHPSTSTIPGFVMDLDERQSLDPGITTGRCFFSVSPPLTSSLFPILPARSSNWCTVSVFGLLPRRESTAPLPDVLDSSLGVARVLLLPSEYTSNFLRSETIT